MKKLTPQLEDKILQLHNEGKTLREIAEILRNDPANPITLAVSTIYYVIKRYKTIVISELIPEIKEQRIELKLENQAEFDKQVNQIIKIFGDKVQELYDRITNGENVSSRDYYLLLRILQTYSNIAHMMGMEVHITQEEVFQNLQDRYLKKKVEQKTTL
jgi:hypothetical protein